MQIVNKTDRIGCHMSKDNFVKLSKFMENYGYNAAQIFTKSPMSVSKINKSNDDAIKSYIHSHDIQLFVHSQYIINGCKKTNDNLWGLNSIIDDMCWLDAITQTQTGVVLHLGKNCAKYNLTNHQAKQAMLESILYILEKTSHLSKTLLLLETSSGQGAEICCDLHEFVEFINDIPDYFKSKIGICLDTAHIWASGYDLTNTTVVDDTLSLLQPFLKFVHLNDSKVPLDSKKDRHAPLNSGFIFKEDTTTLDYFVSKVKNLKVPIILETKGNYAEEITLLRNFN